MATERMRRRAHIANLLCLGGSLGAAALLSGPYSGRQPSQSHEMIAADHQGPASSANCSTKGLGDECQRYYYVERSRLPPPSPEVIGNYPGSYSNIQALIERAPPEKSSD